MSYLQLNKRQSTGNILESIELKETNNIGTEQISTIKLIKLDKPYKDGTAYAVSENTMNAFCSCGLFKSKDVAYDKCNLMLRNCDLISNDEFESRKKTKYYL